MDSADRSFPDEVPADDALEQRQPIADAAPEALGADASAPLESDAGDWQEQHQSLEEFDPDEDRR